MGKIKEIPNLGPVNVEESGVESTIMVRPVVPQKPNSNGQSGNNSSR